MSIIIVGVGPAEFEGELGTMGNGDGVVFPSPMATLLMLTDPNYHPTAMEELDGDEVRVSSRGRYAERDIVQVTQSHHTRTMLMFPTRLQTNSFPSKFVPFRDYVDDSGNQVLSMARLAKDVLAEIPEQLLSYMKTRDIKPRRADPQ